MIIRTIRTMSFKYPSILLMTVFFATSSYAVNVPTFISLEYPVIVGGLLVLLSIALYAHNRTLRKAVNSRTAELKSSKDLFERIYNSVNDAIFIHDIGSGAILDVNERMLEMYGYSRETIINLPVGALSTGTSPFSQAEAIVWMTKAIQGEPQLFEWRAKGCDGHLFWVEINMRRARIGEDDRILVTARDISERKIAEQAINTSRELFAAAFQSGPLLMTISDMETGRYLEVNDNFQRLSGFTREELIGSTSIEIGWLSAEDRELFLRELRINGRASGIELRLNRKNGNPIWCLYFGEIITIAGEQKLLSIVEDITDRNLAEEQLRQAMKMDVVGQLAGGIAHDFNNMLTVILGASKILEKHVTHDPLLIKLVSAITEAATRSAELTHQLLAFSRKGERSQVKFNINETITAAISLLEHSIDKNILLETRLLAHEVLVSGDPTLLQNALLNLGTNARDAMPEGGKITFTTANMELDNDFCASHAYQITPGQFLEISVSDTGYGMEQEIIKHIFEPFFSTKAVGEGTGLGLALVYGTVKGHQGCIDVYSEPGIGTVFKIYIPVIEGQEPVATEVEEYLSGSGGVLLVDDEPLLRNVGKYLLEEMGYKVYLAQDGEQALEVYDRERGYISLVILDMVMPRMGGKETLTRLVKKYPDIKVLISSGFHPEETPKTLEDLGAIGFVHKPYRRLDLSKAVSKALMAKVVTT